MKAFLANLKVWGWVLLASFAAVATAGAVTLKGQRDRARQDRDHARATIHAERTKKKIVKEEKEKLSLKESEIKEEVKKLEEGKDEEFKGLSNLSDPNNF